MRAPPNNSSTADARTWRCAKVRLQTLEISHPPELLTIATPTLHLMQLRVDNRCAPFSTNDGCLSTKGDLLSIVTQGLLLDLGPLTSWP